MSFENAWINEYHSLIQLKQDPITGMLSGKYSSTTGGTGTYDVVGWASLDNPTEQAGKPMAITVLWRSNDGGKSDPSHEVSGMAGQVITMDNNLKLSLVHIFVETDPVSSKIEAGFYPDKLIFLPKDEARKISSPPENNDINTTIRGIAIAGKWKSSNANIAIDSIQLMQPDKFSCNINGIIQYKDGSQFEIIGFTDIYATSSNLSKQAIGFSSYIDVLGKRTCISMAGYFDANSNKIRITSMHSIATANDANYTQVNMELFELERLE
jgi:hypothetical protein